MSDRLERTTQTSWTLTPTSAAPAQARAYVARALAGTPFEARSDDAQLAVSELVTNAVLHGRAPMTLSVTVTEIRARIEVSDASPLSPAAGILEPTAMTGRGLVLVATCSDAWGVDPAGAGKSVWFELRHLPGAGYGVEADDLLASWGEDLVGDPADENVLVVLPQFDTRQIAAAKIHIEDLLREFTLLLEQPDGADPEDLAVARRAIAAGQAFDAVRSSMRQQIQAAIAAGQPRVTIKVHVARGDADLVREYSLAMDAADRLCASGKLLVVSCSPELSETRREYLRHIAARLSV